MSDILIKGIEMPTGNDELRLIIRSNGQVIISHQTYYEETEAAPVPPHGKLKDADAIERNLLKMQQAQTGPCSHGVRKSRAVLRDAPTIIPASEEGGHELR